MFALADPETFRRVCFVLITLTGLASLPVLDPLWRGLASARALQTTGPVWHDAGDHSRSILAAKQPRPAKWAWR